MKTNHYPQALYIVIMTSQTKPIMTTNPDPQTLYLVIMISQT